MRTDVRVETADPSSDEVRTVVKTYLAEITAMFGHDTTRAIATNSSDFAAPRGRFLVIRDDAGSVIGGGGVRLLDDEVGEIKRMWVSPTARGRGVGAALLTALEASIVELGASRGVLDTNEALTAALSLYRRSGWREVPSYNDNPEATHWFAKDLSGPRGQTHAQPS